MTTVTLWVLMIISGGYHSAVRVDQFASEADCVAGSAAYTAIDKYERPVCIKMRVARP